MERKGFFRTTFVSLAAITVMCGCTSYKKNISLSLDESLQYAGPYLPSVEVHLVGVGDRDRQLWERYSMTDYWKPGDNLRKNAKKSVVLFGEGMSTSFLASKRNPLWKEWKNRGVKYVFVLANLPGVHPDVPGDGDARRSIIPLLTKDDDVDVVIGAAAQP